MHHTVPILPNVILGDIGAVTLMELIETPVGGVVLFRVASEGEQRRCMRFRYLQ